MNSIRTIPLRLIGIEVRTGTSTCRAKRISGFSHEVRFQAYRD
jgi:hypothetical protein